MWSQLIILVVSWIVSAALAPKPERPKPAALEDLNVPTVDTARPVPVVFGTVWVSDPNIVWYGDLRTTPIKKKGGKK